ncbi:uncharacterized protein LOC112555126 [Pomacea canaliculata]|uniref:uncharacterized protein LOC112555126 n=1 Tax=Pomacea canaliculata TaxID=400727 RepID=UPI000D73AB64|nr:uncharacterized protein LOC112555126 [Pomacea canaliculata]
MPMPMTMYPYSLCFASAADFPVITAVSLSRSPSNHTLLVCDINSQVTAPTARYRLSWGVDGLWREEQEVDSGHLTASVTVSDLPNGVQVACRARSYFTDHNIFSPFIISNVISLQHLFRLLMLAKSANEVSRART